jgi:hypothetical protein
VEFTIRLLAAPQNTPLVVSLSRCNACNTEANWSPFPKLQTSAVLRLYIRIVAINMAIGTKTKRANKGY